MPAPTDKPDPNGAYNMRVVRYHKGKLKKDELLTGKLFVDRILEATLTITYLQSILILISKDKAKLPFVHDF